MFLRLRGGKHTFFPMLDWPAHCSRDSKKHFSGWLPVGPQGDPWVRALSDCRGPAGHCDSSAVTSQVLLKCLADRAELTYSRKLAVFNFHFIRIHWQAESSPLLPKPMNASGGRSMNRTSRLKVNLSGARWCTLVTSVLRKLGRRWWVPGQSRLHGKILLTMKQKKWT